MLWRASASGHEFFRRVDLGPHEEAIRQALLTGKAGEKDWFSVNLARWLDPEIGVAMMDPYRTRFDHINYYVIYLEHYIAYCKVDKRIASRELRRSQLKPNEPLIVIARKAGRSKERSIIVDMVQKQAK